MATANLNLTLPTVNVTSGPTYATQINAAFTTIDAHDHTTSKGKKIPTAGLNIDANLEFNNFFLTEVKATKFEDQTVALSTSTDRRGLYSLNGELNYIDGSGNAVQITSAGAVNVSGTGNITGLAGTSAAFTYNNVSKTFIATQSSGVAAHIQGGNIQLQEPSGGANVITLAPATSFTTNYSIVLPATGPSANQILRQNSGDTNTDFIDLLGTSGQITLTHNAGNITLSLPATITQATTFSTLLTFGANIRGNLGAVGTPSYSFTGDTNTGMWSSAGDIINFSCNATEILEIDTTSIDSTVAINATGNSTNTGNFTVTGDLLVDTSTFKVDSTANRVGIGTATPAVACHIEGTTRLNTLTASRALELDSSKDIIATTITGTGSFVKSNSPTLVTPALGTPASGTLTNCTGLPITAGVSGLGTNVSTFLATPTSLNLKNAVTDETGSGALVFGTSPTLVTPALGTPSTLVLTNATGTPTSIGLANGTGLPIDGGTTGTLPVARGGTGVTTSTGTGNVVLSASPTFTGTINGLAGSGASLTSLNANNISSGTLAVARGGTGTTTSTGSGSVVLSSSPAFTGTPTGSGAGFTSLNASNISSGTLAVARGGTGATATTGSGNNVLSTSPSLTTPAFTGTPTGTITSGTWTPTFTNVVGSSAVTDGLWIYTRIGDIVSFSGRFTVTSNSVQNAQTRLTLPISSNFALNADVRGAISWQGLPDDSGGDQPLTCVLRADTTNDEIFVQLSGAGAGTEGFGLQVSGHYIIK